MAGEDEIEGVNRDEEQVQFNSANLSSDWPFNGPNDLANTSMSMITSSMNNPSCSSAPMIDSFWDHHPTNSQNLGAFCDMNLQNTSSSSSSLGFRKGNLLVPARNLDMCWPPPNSTIKRGGMFLPPPPAAAASTMLPHSLSQFPADSGFIERAARLSSFSAGNFEDMINPFGTSVPESSLSPYSSGSRGMQGQGQPQDGFVGNGFKSASAQGSKDIPPPVVDCGANDGSQPKSESFVRSVHEPKQGGSCFSGNNGPGEAEFSEGGQDDNSNEGLESKKRRRSDQDTDYNQVKRSPQTPSEATKNNTEVQQKGDNNPNSAANKSSGKHGKQVSQSSDAQKEEYIHVRARRGQATNSHSLAERVRREKISERMKFLQDLVPGCSKVTGKAVMLDEIINYVQSLQRQVEFLSMKLATVNPRMDFNIEGLLAKDVRHIFNIIRGPSGTLGFGPDMSMPYTPNSSQMAIMQGGLSGVGGSSDAVRRTINSHLMAIGGYKDPTSQVPSSWDDELHNIVQMGLNPSTPISSQNLGSTPPSHLKAEP
ncbi:hypothetical protein OSB04_018189 [Centaurea solstitialis]|uniref:BHLH domain-containing protein n=1 Tax=Centaurea solstitialis TaxID=347529 RepID=A0AA38T4B9_9ASTR|nr:hypothetical protein OSB04_018189 [Centaurea solstitialis]